MINIIRGAGKSTLMAAIVISWMLLSDNFGGEAQVLAYDNSQSDEVYEQVMKQLDSGGDRIQFLSSKQTVKYKGKIVNKTGNIMVPYISEDGRTAVTIRNGKVYFGEDSGLNIASSEKISQVANITSTIQNAINSTMTKLSDSNCLYNGSNLADFVRTNFNNN